MALGMKVRVADAHLFIDEEHGEGQIGDHPLEIAATVGEVRAATDFEGPLEVICRFRQSGSDPLAKLGLPADRITNFDRQLLRPLPQHHHAGRRKVVALLAEPFGVEAGRLGIGARDQLVVVIDLIRQQVRLPRHPRI